MKRTWAILGLFILTFAQAAYAHDLPPPPLRDKGKQPRAQVRYVSTSVQTEYGELTSTPCRFKFTDPYFGYFQDQKYFIEEKLPVQLSCYDSNDDFVVHGWVIFDPKSAAWVQNLISDLPSSSKVYQLQTPNAQGWAYTLDDMDDAKRYRSRYLWYCLIHKARAVCGEGRMGYLTDIQRHPSHNLTPYTLKVLRSIEFIDDDKSAPAEQQGTNHGFISLDARNRNKP